jgi:histidinol-phosphate aminotransferase
MERQAIRIAPQVLDLAEPAKDPQEALFPTSSETPLRLDNNESTVAPSPNVINILKKAIDTVSLNNRSDIQARKLRRQLSQYSGVAFDSIACYANQAAALETLARTYLYSGMDALIVGPADNPLSHYASAAGARVINSQFRDPFEPAIEELVSGITQQTRLIYISNPNGVSGATLSEPEIVFLLSYAQGIMVVVDESYYEYCGVTVADLIDRFPNLIVLRTFSKAFGLAGFDTHYLLTCRENMKYLSRLGYGKTPGLLAQVAAGAALDDLYFPADLNRQINESKNMLYEGLTRLGYDFRITSSNFFLLAAANTEHLVKTLAKQNIFVRDISHLNGFQNYVRITIGTPSQAGILLDILSELSSSQKISLKLVRHGETAVTAHNDRLSNYADELTPETVNSGH